MILRRLGNKSKIAEMIQTKFPEHKIYIEPFFGAGGMFFNKRKAKYNMVNDIDSDVFNLYQVLKNNKDELIKEFEIMPIHADLLKHWKDNLETEPIKKALRFLFLSNFTFMGSGEIIKTGTENPKSIFIDRVEATFKMIFDVQFLNCDFRRFFIEARINDASNTFIYCDPPYLGTNDNYSNSFTEQDSEDLFYLLMQSKCKFAVSEFDHPFILEQAQKNGLNTIIIGERQNLKNRRTEILITNYEQQPTLFS